MKCDTGESTAAINRRGDDEAWPRIERALRDGATLYRPPRLDRYYIDFGEGPTGPSLSAARVRKLEAEGVLKNAGVCRYGLA